MASLLEYDPGLLKVLASAPDASYVTLKELTPVIEAMMADVPRVLANQRDAFLRLQEASIMPIQTIGQPPYGQLKAGKDAQVCIKTGYLQGDLYFVAKVAAGGGEYAGNTGMMMLFSQRTLKLEKMLLDEGLLTEIRTAAASALASDCLMPKKVTNLALFGCGIQSIWQLRFLAALFKVRGQQLPTVQLKTRSLASSVRFIEAMKGSACALDRNWRIVPLVNARACELIHTVTTNRGPDPLLRLSDVHPGAHITAVGADSPGKFELDLAVIDRARLCLTDSLKQTAERGEYQHYIKAQGWDEATMRASGKFEELGAFLARRSAKRPEGISIFDSSGVAVQDVAIATLAVQMYDEMRPAAARSKL